jgi:hypothetical protein
MPAAIRSRVVLPWLRIATTATTSPAAISSVAWRSSQCERSPRR